MTRREFAESTTDRIVKAQIPPWIRSRIPPDAIARAFAFAIEQPADIDVSDIDVRPTAKGWPKNAVSIVPSASAAGCPRHLDQVEVA
jgi:hypothetical protein